MAVTLAALIHLDVRLWTTAELAERSGYTKRQVRATMKALKARGLVREYPRTAACREHRWIAEGKR